MRKMQMFESPEFGQVGTLTGDGEDLFFGSDKIETPQWRERV